jgi:hypothetical protein
MDNECVVCKRKVGRTENYLRCHLWGAFATLHWRCFGNYLRTESEPEFEETVWKASSLTKSN